MKIHHLNCGTMCPVAAKLVAGDARKLVCHCLLIETNNGLVLVDTGFGTQDLLHPKQRLSRNVSLIGPKFDLKETAIEQIKHLGFSPTDVRHIVLTHLDMDHAGGLSDFPHATVHLYRREFDAATSPQKNYIANHRYRAIQWAHQPNWELYDNARGDSWFGFSSVKDLKGLPPEILLVPLTGHTLGHCGIAVQSEKGWLLHAGDAYFFHKEMHEPPSCTTILSTFQKILATDNRDRIANQMALRALSHRKDILVDVFCAHDSVEFERQTTSTRL